MSYRAVGEPGSTNNSCTAPRFGGLGGDVDFSATQPLQPPPQPVRFHGTGGDYFRIWIVNLALTIVTLGIYGAWAKVRRLQYMYRNTELAGSSFEYWGQPLTILKGRIVALVLLLLYKFGFRVSTLFGVAVLVLLAAVLPVLLRNSMRFRLHNSSYHGLRFSFHGSVGQAYVTFLFGYLLTIVTLGLAAPYFHWKLKRYQHGEARFGQAAFSFAPRAGAFYAIYVQAWLLLIAAIAGIAIFISVTLGGSGGLKALAKAPPPALATAAFMFVVITLFLLYSAFFNARLQNLIWNGTRLGEHRFEYRLSVWPLFVIYFGNWLFTLLTLGFYYPWAMVRLMRYKAECMTLVPAGSLDDFVASQEQEVGAAGEETADLFDIDISF